MQIVFNNNRLSIVSQLTLAELLQQQGIAMDTIAVTVDNDIVPRAKIKDFIVQDGMVVDVFTLVAGG